MEDGQTGSLLGRRKMDGGMNGWMDGRKDEWVDGCLGRWLKSRKTEGGRQVDGWLDG